MNFKKLQSKCKTFYETQSASHFQEIIQPSRNPSPSDKILLRLSKKIFLTDIYRNIQTFAFKVLQKCSSSASRNGAVQMFFLTLSRNMYAGKFLKSDGFLTVLRDHIIFNVKWVEVRKMSNVFRAKLYCKMSDLSFCWLWDFLLENLKLKRYSEDVRWNIWANIKDLYARNNIFKKIIPNMTFWIIYVLVQISFLETALGRFSQCFF